MQVKVSLRKLAKNARLELMINSILRNPLNLRNYFFSETTLIFIKGQSAICKFDGLMEKLIYNKYHQVPNASK